MARIFRPTPRNLSYLAGQLRAGELVAVPTETVYGLAGNALDRKACRKIFTAKRRPRLDPLIVHVHSREQLGEICVFNSTAEKLADAFWPGPLTLILPKTTAVPLIVTAGGPSVAVRMPRHAVFRQLLRLTGKPLAAPSANPFGYISPTTAAHVAENLGTRIRYILNGGPAEIGLESTIVDVRVPNALKLLRPGAISLGDIRRAVGKGVTVQAGNALAGNRAQVAPGLLKKHYSPRTPVKLHPTLAGVMQSDSEAYVFMRKPARVTGSNIFWFDERGDLHRVAQRLFALLRQVDGAAYQRIHVERAHGEDGLAAAINDRLVRAAAR